MLTTDDLARLEAAIAAARASLGNVDDSACRCHEAYKNRGLKDPGCNCDTYDDIAAISALVDSPALQELCRVYAAVLGAPEVLADALIWENVPEELEFQCVRLVPLGAGKGDGNG